MALNLRPVVSNVTNWKKVDEGEANCAAVQHFFATHLCCTQRECAEALGLSVMAVNRHVRTIRAKWRKSDDD
jgi:hypothetical protein